MATGQAIVTKALNDLKSSITDEDKRTFKDATLETLWKDAREIESEQGRRLALQHMRRIEPMLRTLESYATTIDTLCQGFSPMAWVWGPIKLMLMLARQHETVMDKILETFSDIAAVLPRLDKMKETFGDSVDFQQVLSLIYSDILEFHRRVYKFFRRKAWHLWFAFDWGLFERRFKSILGKLSAHCDLLDKEAAAMHFFEMKNMRDTRQREDDEAEQRRHRKMAREVLGWLSAAEDIQDEYLHKLADERQPETCNWILSDDDMYSWIEDESGDPILWLTGIPGAGKSFLSSLIIQHIQSKDRIQRIQSKDQIQHIQSKDRKDRKVLYYFCGQSSDKDNCGLVLRTLANQLVRLNMDLAPLIHQAYLQKGSSLSSYAMKRMLKDVLSTVKSTYIVLDGVDEYDYIVQKDVLRSLMELQKHAGENCKILVSSRETPVINKAITAKRHLRLGEKTAEDLSLYIEGKVETIKESFPELDPGLLRRVEQRLKDKAGRMFLWVRLVTSMLERQASEWELENAIDQLPEGLNAAYGLILERFRCLDSDLKARCFKILFWVCTAYRSMSIHEVADGIALRPGQKKLSRKTRSQDTSKDILDICAPIIEQSKNGTLDLVHFSAKEYLLDLQSGPFVEVSQAHYSIAFSCITNLTSALTVVPRFSADITREEIEKIVVEGGYGLQNYGQQYWAQHIQAYLQTVSNLDDDESKILIKALSELSKVRKQNTVDCRKPSSEPKELQKLAPFPSLWDMTVGWLHFRTQLDEQGPIFESLEAQEKWQLHNDETFLSLLDHELRKITERLLTLNSSNLPSHIRKDDFMVFISRFGFLCRFHNCLHHFRFKHERDTHEATHIPSFPCLECDLSERGFRSRKDLEKHVQRYHKSMEDFEIPDSLHAAGISSRTTNKFATQGLTGLGRTSRCFNDKGRKVLQHSFEQVLNRVESDRALTDDRSNRMTPANLQGMPSLGDSCKPKNVSQGLETIRQRINEQHYQSLAEFKADLRQIPNDSDLSGHFVSSERVETLCDQELERCLADYPDFANVCPSFSTTPKHVIDESFSDINRDTFQVGLESVDDCPESLETEPYWSLAEQKHFPSLIQRYGRDYAKISDFLKTKTVIDVEQRFLYLVSMGREDLSSLADAADIRLRLQSRPAEPDQGPEFTPSALSLINNSAHDCPPSHDNFLTQPSVASVANVSVPDLSTINKHSALIGDVPGPDSTTPHGERNIQRKKYKRRPHPKAFCEFCTNHPNGLHNEHTLKKHIRSIHTATRKIWICVDISIDKMFLAKCANCSSDKRYRSKLNATKHLKGDHFSEKTRPETLFRWIKEVEEPNPSYVKGQSDSLDNGTDLPSIRQVLDRQTADGVASSRGGLNRLPALQNILDRSSPSSRSPSPNHSVRSTTSDDISEPDGVSHDKNSAPKDAPIPDMLHYDLHIPEVSFDNLLFTPSAQISVNPESDPATRTLIRPDHVPRLPNLDSFRMAACQDQVDALHERLNNEITSSQRYQEALDGLTHLSRTLRRDLVDWRRTSTVAPTFPVKI
ncbi:hypothetical protein MMC07_001639 [Pseudocyphellaria aurata]|nr:hypothetical protein [Pseudocyphellaria aurata]